MDLFKELRDKDRIKALFKEIEGLSRFSVNIMEICGGHTNTIMKYGLDQMLPESIHFIHGPGCPVCVMPKERIDQAIALANEKNVILVTLGDMMRVPGSKSSLIRERAKGRDVRMLYSPMDIPNMAKENPSKIVIYFAIGFETTAPMTAALIDSCVKDRIHNVLFHVNHVLVPPPIEAIMEGGDVKIDAFIGPGHVCVITGMGSFEPIVKKYRTPVVICGFEPLDVLRSILMILSQFIEGRRAVENQYKRAVKPDGNKKAMELMSCYFEARDMFRWRGMGDIALSAFKLKDEFKKMD